MPSVPSDPDEHAPQVDAWCIKLSGAEPGHPTTGQDHFEAEDVIHGGPVGKRMRAAGICADVATDRADPLGRGVGSVLQAVRRERLLEVQVDGAGFDRGGPIGNVDLADLVHPGERDQHTALDRESAPGETGAGAARDHGNAVF